MTTKQLRQAQKTFLGACMNSSQTLDEILDDLNLPPETLAGWLTQRDFRVRLHGMRRYLKRARELQIEIGAWRAAQMLTRAASDTAPKDLAPVTRTACVDLIRLSRDSRARNAAANPHVDDLTKNAALYHLAVPEEEARELMESLEKEDALRPALTKCRSRNDE